MLTDAQYAAICEVIDRAKMDDDPHDTDTYASEIAGIVAQKPAPGA